MNIIICQAYASIPGFLSLIEKENKEFILITTNKQLYKFFCSIYSRNNIKLYNSPKSFYSINILKNAIHNLKLKKRIKNDLNKYSNCNIYFGLVAFSYILAYAVIILSKRNAIYYSPTTKLPPDLKQKNTLYTIINKTILRLFYKVETNSIYIGKTTVFAYNHLFFKHINAQYTESLINRKSIETLVSKKFKKYTNRILFLSGALVDIKLVESNEYNNKVKQLISFIGQENFVLKLHPRFNKKQSCENYLDEIEDFFPANLLIYNFNIILGYQTATLYEAANADKCAISLLRLLNPVNEEIRTQYINFLEQNLLPEKCINYPENINELHAIIKNEKAKNYAINNQ